MDDATMKRLIELQQAEVNGVLTYQTLAGLTEDTRLKEIFTEIARDEGKHAAYLKTYTNAVLTPHRSAADNIVAAFNKVGLATLLYGVSKGEYSGYDNYVPYEKDFPLITEIMQDELRHGKVMAEEAEKLSK